MTRLQTATAVAAIAAATAFAVPAAQAEIVTYTADLTGAAEVPANDSTATGTVTVTVDTDAGTVNWDYTSEGLSGPAIASHVHGPADKDTNAAPLVDTSSGEQGTADATDEAISALADGMAYFNIHTEKYPDGEIRGQLAPEGQSESLSDM